MVVGIVGVIDSILGIIGVDDRIDSIIGAGDSLVDIISVGDSLVKNEINKLTKSGLVEEKSYKDYK